MRAAEAPGGRRPAAGAGGIQGGLARWPDECYGVGELSGIVQTDQGSLGFPVVGGEGWPPACPSVRSPRAGQSAQRRPPDRNPPGIERPGSGPVGELRPGQRTRHRHRPSAPTLPGASTGTSNAWWLSCQNGARCNGASRGHLPTSRLLAGKLSCTNRHRLGQRLSSVVHLV